MTDHVLTERHGAVMTIRLNRPEKKNALTRDMYRGMAAGLHADRTSGWPSSTAP